MDHHGLRHHDEEHHVDEVTCPNCSKSFEFGKGKPTTCMSCGEDLRPMRSKTSPANQDDMHIRNMPNQGTLNDTGGNSLVEGLMKTHGSIELESCPECGADGKLEEQEPGRFVCVHCKTQVPKDFSARDPHGLGELHPYNEKDPESMSTSEQAGWGGGGSRHLKDEGFTASVHIADNLEFEIVEIAEPDSEFMECQHEQGIYFPKGMTDALHEALTHLNAWMENPKEDGKLRPYREYSSVIRPKIIVGEYKVGVEDPHMAEIINHVARTDDVSAIYKEPSLEKEGAFLAPLAALLPEGLTAALGALGLGGAEAAAGAGAAGLGEAAAAGAGEAAAGGGLLDSIGSLIRPAMSMGKKYLGLKGAESVIDDVTGGGSPAPASDMGGSVAIPDLLATSHVVSTYGDQLETPDSITKRVDTENPEKVDPHEINDGDNDAINSYDPKVNADGQSRSPRGEDKTSGSMSPAIERFLMMLPLILNYCESDEGGADDPMMQALHESLEKEFPGYLDGPDIAPEENHILLALNDHHRKEAAMAPVMNPDQMAAPVGPNSASNPSGPNPVKEICPSHGQVKNMETGFCPQCTGPAAKAGDVAQGKNADVKNRTQQDVYDPDRDGKLAPPPQQQQATARTAADHQGPHTQEQFIAVGELLESEGREDEIVEMLKHPNEFAEELAKIQQTQSPVEDVSLDAQTAAPPAPPQEGPAPNQGMPVPPMGGPGAGGGAPGGMQSMGSSMLKAAFKYSADNVAGKCPKCDGHSTKMVKQDGRCKCHTCGHIWKDKHFEPSDGDSSNSSTTSSYIYSNELEMADIDEGHPSETQSWKDSSGQPLTEGKEYSMKSALSTIPDTVRILSVKPDSLEYVINEDSGIPEEVTISLDDVRNDGLEFIPAMGNQSENPAGIEENADGKPLPEAGSDNTDLSTPHQFVSSKTAGKHYTPMEQRELIDEYGEARNANKLDLAGTHYIEADDDHFLFGC